MTAAGGVVATTKGSKRVKREARGLVLERESFVFKKFSVYNFIHALTSYV